MMFMNALPSIKTKASPVDAGTIGYGPFQFLKRADQGYDSATFSINGINIPLAPTQKKIIELLMTQQGKPVTLIDFAQKLDSIAAQKFLEDLEADPSLIKKLPASNFAKNLKVQMSAIRRAILQTLPHTEKAANYAECLTTSGKKSVQSGYTIILPGNPKPKLSPSVIHLQKHRKTPSILSEIFNRARKSPLAYGDFKMIPGAKDDFSDATLKLKDIVVPTVAASNKIMAVLIDKQGAPASTLILSQALGHTTANEEHKKARVFYGITTLRKTLGNTFGKTSAGYIKSANPRGVAVACHMTETGFKILLPVNLKDSGDGKGASEVPKITMIEPNILSVRGISVVLPTFCKSVATLVVKHGGPKFTMEEFCIEAGTPQRLQDLNKMQTARNMEEYRTGYNGAKNNCAVALFHVRKNIKTAYENAGLHAPEDILALFSSPESVKELPIHNAKPHSGTNEFPPRFNHSPSI